ncbi:MAG: hypothetical protein RL329_1778 [Bacteroidota bacterium]|jgi:uncharacterized protein (TIGR02646 family)
MIPIRKYATPRGLKNIKKTRPTITYDQFSSEEDCKMAFDELRNTLITEQGNICCYCQQKIAFKTANTGKPLMKTEHFVPKKGKDKDESKQLDYNNLLAACLGNQDSGNENHCDSSKSDARLQVLPNPAEIRQSNFDGFLIYKVREREGCVDVIAADLANLELKKDIEERLHLNEQNLRQKRFAVWNAIWRKVNKGYKIDIQQVKDIIEKYECNLNESGERDFYEFAGFIVQWYRHRFKDELKKL